MIGSSIQNVNIVETPIVTRKVVVMEETLLSLFGFDVVISEMLDVAVFLASVIPFKSIPAVFGHRHSCESVS